MRLTSAILAILVSIPAVADDRPDPDKLIDSVKGTLPIIISAPHGGVEDVPGVGERTGFAVNQFVTIRDTGTRELAMKLAEAIEKRMGAKAHLVVAKFDRKYIDANRTAIDAYEWKSAKPVYDQYHQLLATARKTVEDDWGRGLLIDLHGQASDKDAIYRGTNNGKTVTHLLDRFGKSALTGPKSVLGVMEKKGYKVLPNCISDDLENASFGGGFISQKYGSKDGGTVDAIQLEMGGMLRIRVSFARVSADLAEAIEIYAKEYLPEKPKKP